MCGLVHDWIWIKCLNNVLSMNNIEASIKNSSFISLCFVRFKMSIFYAKVTHFLFLLIGSGQMLLESNYNGEHKTLLHQLLHNSMHNFNKMTYSMFLMYGIIYNFTRCKYFMFLHSSIGFFIIASVNIFTCNF